MNILDVSVFQNLCSESVFIDKNLFNQIMVSPKVKLGRYHLFQYG